MGAVGRELVQGARSLGRAPGYTLASVLVLALAIGATTLVFSIVHGVLLRPLPCPGSERLGIVWHDFAEEAFRLRHAG